MPRSPGARSYGQNPYVGYDSRDGPYPLFQGDLPTDVNPMMRVVVVGGEAWTLPLLREKGTIRHGDVTIRWLPGQNSALDSGRIAAGRDVGNVIVQRGAGPGAGDVVHDVTFAFVFRAFRAGWRDLCRGYHRRALNPRDPERYTAQLCFGSGLALDASSTRFLGVSA